MTVEHEKTEGLAIDLDVSNLLGIDTVVGGTSQPVAFGVVKDVDGDGVPFGIDPDDNDPNNPNPRDSAELDEEEDEKTAEA